jgi:hypothetical protein
MARPDMDEADLIAGASAPVGEVQFRAATEEGALSRQKDRRRPGRADYNNPALIALLRGPQPSEETPPPASDQPGVAEASLQADDDFDADQGMPARGILIAVMLSVPLWMGIGFAVRFLIGR